MNYRFKELREKMNFKQIDIADKLGISRSVYSNIEAEISNIKLELLLEYCNTFHYSMDYVCNLCNQNEILSLKQMDIIDKSILRKNLNTLENDNFKQAQEIAKELGIAESTYSEYKNPVHSNIIQTLMIKKLAEKYRYSMDWLIGRSNKKYYKI